jgi:DNA-binding transcriptional MerR regulator
MRIGDLARLTGLSAHTIRYYERIGLLPSAPRSAGQRDYDHSVLVWIGFLRRLRTTGMPIREMLRYARLRAEGDGTLAERRALLVAHRAKVRAHRTELEACLRVLDTKIAGYGDPNPEEADDAGERTLRARRAQAG